MVNTMMLVKKDLSFTPYDVQWIPFSARVCAIGATGRSTGQISVYSLEGKQLQFTNETEVPSIVRCGTFGAAESHSRHLATGDFDGQLQIWDTSQFELPVVSVKAHESIINAISGCNRGAREIVTGSRDGAAKVWDTRQPKSAVFTARSKEKAQDIWAVAFGDLGHAEQRLVAVGYDNGDVKLFDLTASQYVWETNVGAGVCSLDFGTKSLAAGTLTGTCTIQLDSGIVSKIPSSGATVWSVRHMPQDVSYFANANGNGDVTVLHNATTDNPSVISVSQHPVTSFDWHKDKKGLFACSAFDQTIRIGLVQGI
ncbi:hypothetical protein EC973_007473 [Apophysomyces ossiformis]|uniref:Uncharacterized protein n=1 Tax=Apophysomyces ossiformis TaxID=679940 RepID=A0A8H7BPP4_9FUNG|nr:hypothetical protein EC973_007473 [Apophysomyces ossiformis]